MITVLFLLVLLLAIALLAPTFGADTRGLSSDRVDRPWYPGHPRR